MTFHLPKIKNIKGDTSQNLLGKPYIQRTDNGVLWAGQLEFSDTIKRDLNR